MATYNLNDLVEEEIAQNKETEKANYEYNELLPAIQLEHMIETKISILKDYKGDPDFDTIKQIIINTNY